MIAKNAWTPYLGFYNYERNSVRLHRVITTIEIIREENAAQQTVYRALSGDQQATSSTPGQALDTLERMLATQGQAGAEGLVVIVQRFRPDVFFSAAQQQRLQTLMERFHAATAAGAALSADEQRELEQLVDAEWQAAIARGNEILKQTRTVP
jgi:hypothetical protein